MMRTKSLINHEHCQRFYHHVLISQADCGGCLDWDYLW